MKPLRIYLKNFMNHRKTEIDCTNFQSILIVGKNKKNDRVSNGVGKTTIFRGIEWILFNQSFGTTLDKIIRDGKKKAVGEFDFELQGEVYRIWRQRTSSSADVRLYKQINGEFESISGRTPSSTETLIKDLIRISHKAFTYSILFRQADLTGITSVADPKKRKEILKEPLNLNMYTKLEEIAVEKRRPLKKKMDNLEGSIQVIGDPEVDIQKSITELKDAEKQIQHHQELLDKNNQLVIQKQKIIDDLKETLGQQDIEIHRRVQEQEESLKKLKKNTRDYNEKLLKISSSIIESKKQLDKYDENKKETQELLDSLLEQKGINLEEIEETYRKVCKDEVKGSELVAGIKAQIKLTKKSLPEEDECPVCHQGITAQYRQEMENSVNAELQKLNKDLDFYKNAMEKCLRKKSKVDENLKAERKRMNDIEREEDNLKHIVEKQKTARENIDKIYESQNEISNKLKEEEQQIEEANFLLANLKEAAGKSSAPEINQRIFSTKQEILDIQKDIKENTRCINSFTSIKGGLEERVKTREADKQKLSELKEDLIKTKREFKIQQMVVDAFSNRGIPSFIIQTILDDLQFEANAALRELRPELEVKIDADLNFEYRRNGVVRDYAQLSHGQQVYIALAFKRGMATIIQRRFHAADLKFLTFDEVDAHLDEAGVEAFADTILKWQKEFKIFVITHNRDLKDKFSHAILVEEGDDGAEARLVDSW